MAKRKKTAVSRRGFLKGAAVSAAGPNGADTGGQARNLDRVVRPKRAAIPITKLTKVVETPAPGPATADSALAWWGSRVEVWMNRPSLVTTSTP